MPVIGVGADEVGGVRVDVEGHVPHRAAEQRAEVFAQHVLAGGLRAGQQQVFARQDRREGELPGLFSVVIILRVGHARGVLGFRGVLLAEGFDARQEGLVHALGFEKGIEITHL